MVLACHPFEPWSNNTPPLAACHEAFFAVDAMLKIEVFNALQNISLSKLPFKTQPQIENEAVTWSPQYNMLATRTNKCRALSLQEVELDGSILILHIVMETCTTWFMHKFNMSFVFHFYVFGLMSWIWTSPSAEALKFGSPSKWNSYEGFNLEHWVDVTHVDPLTPSLALTQRQSLERALPN